MTSNAINADLALATERQYSEQEYADFVGKTLGAIRNDRSQGRGPAFVKYGNTVRYTMAAIRSYTAASTVTPDKKPTLVDAKPRRRRRP